MMAVCFIQALENIHERYSEVKTLDGFFPTSSYEKLGTRRGGEASFTMLTLTLQAARAFEAYRHSIAQNSVWM